VKPAAAKRPEKHPPKDQEWMSRQERGSAAAIRAMVWVALRLDRPAARLLLYPICLYFVIFSGGSRRASRAYLEKALGRAPTFGDLFRHYHCFACCILDRVYLLNDQIDMFELRIEGEEKLTRIIEQGGGCLLFGAHLGSFEVLRALGRRRDDITVSLVMYEENARKINTALNAINPKLAMNVIALGRPSSMIEIGRRLEAGDCVGVLADRSLNDEDQVTLPFLGAPASFPIGPFRMAALLKRPVVMMVGLYRGGRRYDIEFEPLFDPSGPGAGERGQAGLEAMKLYVSRLEHYCRSAPYNWFNFYDFWK
jgi:predicted LPLAT superfamily acyltransferase